MLSYETFQQFLCAQVRKIMMPPLHIQRQCTQHGQQHSSISLNTSWAPPLFQAQQEEPRRSEGEAEAGNKSLGAGEVTTQEDGGRERNKKASLPLLASSGAVSSCVWLNKWLRQTLTSVLPAFGLWRQAPDRAPLCCAWVSGMCSCPSFPHTLLGRKSCIFKRPGKFRGAPLFWI